MLAGLWLQNPSWIQNLSADQVAAKVSGVRCLADGSKDADAVPWGVDFTRKLAVFICCVGGFDGFIKNAVYCYTPRVAFAYWAQFDVRLQEWAVW